MTQICMKKNPSVLIYTGSYSAFEEINSLMKKSRKEHIRDVILHTLPIVNEKCLLFLNCSIYFESIIHANYYRKPLCIYSSFSLKHVSPPESFNLFFFRVKFMLRHLLPQPLLSLIPFNKWEREKYEHTQLFIFHCTGVLAHLTVCTHVDENWNLSTMDSQKHTLI